ncbi:eukaryotic-like serine/threonine-protein kinase [Frankia sp. AiPs1]|uniref:protein kinase domain-containing protein n=1 Tax=Frankia sp. AiPa1 TaxID=573492 RepID=UPI00202ACF0C|nr:protein kinase [Frankia sp. AiPa1]MCL9759298.1 protein kinase [Frankia sp. AiPa1]
MARGRRRPADMLGEQERVAAALPGYTLGPPMGVGAYGMVITARHRKLKREVAIKMLSGEPSAESRFAAEAEILAGFDHPHIVRVHDYVETDGLGLIVMELLAGGTLFRRRKDLTQQQACAVGLAVASALSHAHARGVLHRDIKMDNVIFDADGCPKVADFGIARAYTGTGVTGTGQLGTPMYMAPEQITGGRVGPATDLYALGVLLYQLLSGQPPFGGSLSVPLVWQQTLAVTPPPPPGVADPLAAVVLRALAKAPEDRQPDADIFARDLAAAAVAAYGPGWLADTGIPLHPAGEADPTSTDRRLTGNPEHVERRSIDVLSSDVPRPPVNHLAALTAGIVITGVAGTLWVFGPRFADLPAGVSDIPDWFQAAPERAMTVVLGTVAWLCLLWLSAGLLLGELAAAIPGRWGRGVSACAEWLLPGRRQPGFRREWSRRRVGTVIGTLLLCPIVMLGLLPALRDGGKAGSGQTSSGGAAGVRQSLSASPSASARSPDPRSQTVPVAVLNNSRVKGLAEAAARQVIAAGFTVSRTGNYQSVHNARVSTVYYTDGLEAAARSLKAAVAGIWAIAPKSENGIVIDDPLILVVRSDFPVEPPDPLTTPIP